MNPDNLFPEQNNRPEPAAPPRTPAGLRHKFEQGEIRTNIDSFRLETTVPDQNASAGAKSEYLNQISSNDAKRRMLSGKWLILAIAAVVLLVAVAVVSILSGGNQVKNASGEVLGQRIINLQELVTYGKANDVNGANVTRTLAELNLVLLSRVNDLTPLYNTDGKTSFTKPSEKIAAEFSNAQLISKLDQAKSNSNLNSVFVDVLRQSLNETTSLINQLYSQSQNQNLKEALKQTYENLQEIENRLAASAS